MNNENQLEDVRRAGEAIADFGNCMVEVLTPIFQALASTMQATHDAFWRTYLEAGAPYGETDEGFSRWLEELNQLIPDYRRRK